MSSEDGLHTRSCESLKPQTKFFTINSDLFISCSVSYFYLISPQDNNTRKVVKLQSTENNSAPNSDLRFCLSFNTALVTLR